MRPRLLFPLMLTVVLVGTLVAPVSGATATATGTVTHVADGDTLDVVVDGNEFRVRLIGVQAMELGECHADRARRRLEQLVDGKKVTLLADSSESTGRKSRRLRFVEYRGRDVADRLLDEGLVFAFPNIKERERNERYMIKARSAAAAGLGVWNDTACGSGPQQGLPISLAVKWDADSSDADNLNDEWVRVENGGGQALDLTGWHVRDSALHTYTFPKGTEVPARGSVKVHVGTGTDSAGHLYWGKSSPIFDNTVGDGAYLVDPDGDIRAHFVYPCLGICDDRMDGKVAISAKYEGDEWVDLKNRTTTTIDLGGYLVESWPYAMEIEGRTPVPPGETLRVHIGEGKDSPLVRYWGFSSDILNNSGDRVELRTFDARNVTCYAWGDARCPKPHRGPHPVSDAAGATFDDWRAPAWTDATSHDFKDIDRVWQHDPVGFLSENAITNGVTSTRYAPGRNVSRGEMAAFLWRLAGEPKVSTPHGFVDVTKSWQQAPVRWLKASRITAGVDAKHFAPDRNVTRGEMAAFLWRLVDEPTGFAKHGFKDIDKTWQEAPVRWLKAKDITNGVSSTEFGPGQAISRGQMAAFLHRLAQRLR